MSEEEIKRQLRNIRCRELRLIRSIMKCKDCKGMSIESTDHPIIMKNLYHDPETRTAQREGRFSRICSHHRKMIDRFNHECASD